MKIISVLCAAILATERIHAFVPAGSFKLKVQAQTMAEGRYSISSSTSTPKVLYPRYVPDQREVQFTCHLCKSAYSQEDLLDESEEGKELKRARRAFVSTTGEKSQSSARS
jgi:hypothetical protein